MSGQSKRVSTLDKMLAEFEEAKQSIAEGEYKGTAVKVELEAELQRPDYDDDDYCTSCEGDGTRYCSDCDGDEGHEDEEGDWISCETCEGSGRVDCSTCDGTGNGDIHTGWSESSCQDYLLAAVRLSSIHSSITMAR